MGGSNILLKKLVIYCNSSADSPVGSKQCWNVKLGVENPMTMVVNYQKDDILLRDPWTHEAYKNRIAKIPSTTSWIVPKNLKAYANSLFEDLGLEKILKDYGCDRISIHEDVHTSPNHTGQDGQRRRKSIHSLLWEVFEDPAIWNSKFPTNPTNSPPRITRVVTGQPHDGPVVSNVTCRILLVVARSFQYLVLDSSIKQHADAPPGLIQDTLLEIGQYLDDKGIGSRFSLDVVRPGKFSQYEKFLESETSAGRKYDIVHFDLHGALRPEGYKLYFGKSSYNLRMLQMEKNMSPVLPDAAGYEEIDVQKVAELLKKHHVTRIALNACLSSSMQNNSVPSMIEIFIGEGVTSVSAMSYMMPDQTAKLYYDAFYQALILGGKGFHEAAAKGREALRLQSQNPVEWLNPTNFRNRTHTFENRFRPGRPHLRRWGVLLFLMLYLRICPWPNTSFTFSIHIIVISSFQRLHDDPSSAAIVVRLKAAGFWTAIAIIIACLLVYRQRAPSQASEIIHYFAGNMGWIFSRSDHSIGFNLYQEEQIRKKQGAVDFKLSIDHMAIEDKLYLAKKVYLFGDYESPLDSTMESLAKLWLRTGFIDEAYIKDADDFFGFLSRPHLTKRYFNGTAFNDPHRSQRGPRNLLLIKNIDKFVMRLGDRKTDLAIAEESKKMDSWIKSHSKGDNYQDTYLVFTGRKHKDWWLKLPWSSGILMHWGSAATYCPNLPPCALGSLRSSKCR